MQIPSLSRRSFIGAGMTSVSCFALSAAFQKDLWAKGKKTVLRKDPKKILDLPTGFTYEVIDQVGLKMDDGYRSPGRPDGMGCFAHGTDLVLMRNHELSPIHRDFSPYFANQKAPKEAYNTNAIGGVSRIVIDPKTLKVKSKNLVLVGTERNCAGGVSPWGWLSCEESIAKGHGYVFLCKTDSNSVTNYQKIEAYGRFNHEAVCIDPENARAYLTEDRGDSCLYRFLPESLDKPWSGQLQAMVIKKQPKRNLGEKIKVGDSFEVEWVDLQNVDSKDDTLRYEAQEKGAAVLVRGEGIWFADGAVYIVATSGGPSKAGQVFKLEDRSNSKLTLLAQSEDTGVLDGPDNITVAPWGDLVVAEDGSRTPHLRLINQKGTVFDLARNSAGYGEFAGVCFDPTGQTLFFNMQAQGLTVAIRGPFQKLTAEA